MSHKSARTTAVVACLLAATGARAECLNLQSKEPVLFEARLGFHVFPGPPGFADVQKGDAPEPTYVLELAAPICIAADEHADSNTKFSTVQLRPTRTTAAALRGLVGTKVNATLTDLMAANTGHHHETLVATLGDIGAVRPAKQNAGLGLTTVKAFYQALGAGSGDEASKLIVPERRVGPFAPDAMTRFYGALSEPLRLASLSPTGANQFEARYRFRSQAGACNGHAIVTTVSRDGASYISSIHALDGC